MSQTILIIEDEAQTRTLFLNCLTFENYQAIGASCGTEGIDLAKKHLPDLIVCDIMMPDIDGYQVLRHLRHTPKTGTIPFIFLTAKVSMPELRIGMDLGADDYLTKPCTVEQFLAAIQTRLQRHADLSASESPTFHPSISHNTTSEKVALSKEEGEDELPPSIHPLFPDIPPLTAVFEYIETHYTQAICLRDVANHIGYSPAYLTNLVQSQSGRSIKQWIIERRMAEARQLLSQTEKSVKQIAAHIGYSDSGYFTRQFRQCNGLSPKAWRTHHNRSASKKSDIQDHF